jgi:hypothetical protein
MTERWSRGDWAHPGCVRSFIGEAERLARRAESDRTQGFMHLHIRSSLAEVTRVANGCTAAASGGA